MAGLKDNAMVKVRNLADHMVGFVLPDEHKRITFQPNEEKSVRVGDLRSLNYSSAGSVLMREYLAVADKALAEEFGVSADSFDNEYSWTVEDVDRVLQEGSIEELLDALDYAPSGVIDTIKDRAIELEINDVAKRSAITSKTGFDITATIENRHKEGADAEPKKATTPRRRRVTATTSAGR